MLLLFFCSYCYLQFHCKKGRQQQMRTCNTIEVEGVTKFVCLVVTGNNTSERSLDDFYGIQKHKLENNGNNDIDIMTTIEPITTSKHKTRTQF